MDKRSPKPAPAKRDETWVIDPSDVQRHARLRRERDRPGPLRSVARYAAVAVAVAAIGLAYWKRETLLAISVDTSALTNLFAGGAATPAGAPNTDGGEGAASVEAPAVVGTRVSTSIEAEPAEAAAAPGAEAAPRSEAPAAEPQGSEPPGSEPTAAAAEPRPTSEPAAIGKPGPPAPPPEPEHFQFGLERVTVSESQPSAAVLILRLGDRRRASSVTWWTEEGTAKAGSDYVNLGKLTEKFAAGEQNRTLHVPIVGDHNTEGPETFYIVARTRAGDGADIPVTRIEVEIDD